MSGCRLLKIMTGHPARSWHRPPRGDRPVRHAQLVEQERERVRLTGNLLVERRAESVPFRAGPQEYRKSRARGRLEPSRHLARVGRVHPAVVLPCAKEDGGILHAVPDVMERRIRRSEEHTSELQSRLHLVCRLLLEKKKKQQNL